MQLQAKCSYRGVRLDKSNVLTSINPNVVEYSSTPTWYIPTLTRLIYTRGTYGPDPDEQVDLMKKPWLFTKTQKTLRTERGRGVCVIKPNDYLPNLYSFCAGRASTLAVATTFIYLLIVTIVRLKTYSMDKQ